MITWVKSSIKKSFGVWLLLFQYTPLCMVEHFSCVLFDKRLISMEQETLIISQHNGVSKTFYSERNDIPLFKLLFSYDLFSLSGL